MTGTHYSISYLLYACVILLLSCSDKGTQSPQADSGELLFERIDADVSGVDFSNQLIESESSNYYKYMYSYIGGGVATADFNNDDQIDLFFISNQDNNKLYLNQGGLQFKDITKQSGIVNRKGFDAGVSVVDINNDGWLDIYVTRGGWIEENGGFSNLLFINNGVDKSSNVPTFTESAKSYGLDGSDRSIQATFFDYNKDGHVDVFVSNTPDFDDPASDILDLTEVARDPSTYEQKGVDRLYKNNGDLTFTDVSIAAGFSPDIGFGLNPQVGDLNHDGWLDLYICNDFRIPDFVYINQGNGTFRESRNEVVKHMSFNSMGGDIADVNNDGLYDIFTLDMNPEDYIRSKTTMGMTSQSRFEEMVEKDYHHQYMHNMLHLNNGNGSFSEVSKLAGVGDTDWSWSCLLADFDLDGYNDIYVTNGVFRDVIDRDANNTILQELRANKRKPSDADFLSFAKMLPQQKMTNYIFRNKGDLTFEDVTATWSNAVPSFSNGAAYADLDGDGDLEIIVNNINEDATILKNLSKENQKGNYLQVKLEDPTRSISIEGAEVELTMTNGDVQIRQAIRSRGFLSSVSGILHFGMVPSNQIKSMKVTWSDGSVQIMKDVKANQVLSVQYQKSTVLASEEDKEEQKFQKLDFDYKHIDPSYNDYQSQILLPHKLSQTGPAVAVGDINGDGLDDLYLGGGHTQAGQLLLGRNGGGFAESSTNTMARDKQKEDVDASFFDADGDGDLDLYVVSGSYEFANKPKLLVDRLYINDGSGNMTKSRGVIPEIAAAGSVVRPSDIDGDGDMDLFLGSRVVPGHYPVPPNNYILINENGKYSEVPTSEESEITKLGMITDAAWGDIDKDGDDDLIVLGEWLGVEVFINTNGELQRSTAYEDLSSKTGWWNTLELLDVDDDGDMDIVAGNLGLNSKLHASEDKPIHVYTNDFDYNGTTDIFLAKYYKDQEVPVRGKTCATQQLPHLGNKIATYNQFATSTIDDIIGPGIKSALHLQATEFRSGIFINNGDLKYDFQPFPNTAQRSPINGIVHIDINGDGKKDFMLAGNNHMPEIETTRYDAGVGSILIAGTDGKYIEMSNGKSGFWATKDVRNLKEIKTSEGSIFIVINNDDTHDFYKLQ